MKTKIHLFFALFFTIVSSIFAQTLPQSAQITKVNIGDALPEIRVPAFSNSILSEIDFSKFKGKILILDFWAINCTACVESWPKLLKLQREFKDQMQIVLINRWDTDDKILPFVKKQERIHDYKMTIPITAADKRFDVMFPHGSVPHVVFIDQSGIVKYIAQGGYLNRETIQNMIAHKEMEILEKKDRRDVELGKFNRYKPLYINGNLPNKETGSDIMMSVILAPYSGSIWGTNFGNLIAAGKPELGGSFGFVGNQALKQHFQFLYGRGTSSRGYVQNCRVVFRNVDSTRLLRNPNGVFKPENCYTLQLTSNQDIPVELVKAKMIKYLEDYFGLKTGWEKQVKKCLVFSSDKNKLKPYTNGNMTSRVDKTIFEMNKLPMIELIERLNRSVFSDLPYPMVDETGFSGELGLIRFETEKALNLNNLTDELQKHGLILSLQDREVDMLVISDAR